MKRRAFEPKDRVSLFQSETGKFNGTIIIFVIMFAVLGVAVVDGGSIMFAKLQLHDLADAAASEASAEYRKDHNEARAMEAAELLISERDKSVKLDEDSFSADPNTESVTFTITKDASVMFIDKIPPLEDWSHLKVTVDTPPTII